MKKEKRYLAALLALCTFLFSIPAFAGAGDITIYRTDADGDYESMRAVIYFDSTLYIFTYGENYYTWARESGELVKHAFDQTGIEQEDGGYANIYGIVASADAMYALVVNNEVTDEEDGTSTVGDVTLYQIGFAADGTASFGEGVALDWGDMIQYNDYGDYSREVRFPFITGNILSFFTYGENGTNNEVFAYDIETGTYEVYGIESDAKELDIQAYCSYQEGMGLIATYSYGEESSEIVFYTIDLQTGDTEEAFSMPITGYTMPTNLLYDEKTDTLYFTLDGELKRMTNLDLSTIESVAAVQIDAWSERSPALTEDGYFICSDYETVIARSTDPNARAEKTLTVYTGYNQSLESAYYTFSAKHADTDVVLSTNYQDVSEAMLNQSTAVDVYTVSVSSDDYAALFDRGYLAELTESETLTGLVSEMYPDVQAAVMKDGQLLALPIEMYTGNSMSYNSEAFKALGLTEDDLPKTWKDLFRLIQRFPDLTGDTGIMAFEGYMTQKEARTSLFYSFMSAYMLHIKKVDGSEMAFDTQIMNETLDEFEKIDFVALGLPEEYDDSYTYTEDTRSKILFQSYADISCSAYKDEYVQPLLLALEDGADPMIEMYITVAFVNPYSENRDLAIEYLEDAAGNMNDMFLVNICPDRNDPIRNSYYQETVDYYEEQIESMQAELEKASEDEKESWQEQLTEWEGYLTDFEKNGAWEASEESIAAYRVYAKYLVASEYFGMDDSNAGEFYDQVQQYLDGTIDKATMLKNIDKKLKMMLMEGM